MRYLRFALLATLCCHALVAQSPKIVVDQGYLSSNPTPGSKAHIWAQQNTATRVFGGWTGDVQYLLDPLAPYTTFQVPNADVDLKATYRTVPAWTVRSAVLNGSPVSYHIPPNPVGLAFIFHGTGGSGADQFTGSELLSFLRDLVAAGFGVAAFDSLDRDAKRWNNTTTGPTNPDVVRLNGIIAAMRTQQLISPTLPLVAFGHSNGGHFSTFSSMEMKWAAVSISSIQGSEPASLVYNGPVAWWLPKNDDHPIVGPEGVATSLTRYETHVNRGLHGRHTIQQPMPLFPERFARSSYVTMADSLEVYGIFKAKAWLDENDFLLQNPNRFDWRSALPARYTNLMKDSIRAQLGASYMTHDFGNYTPHITIDLFLRGVGLKPVVRPVSGASYAGPGLAPDSIATIFTSALATGLEVAANGPQPNLRGVNAVLRSVTGSETPAPWLYVSQGQGSFVVPAGLSAGDFVLKIQTEDRRMAFPMTIAETMPGIFTANASGQGAPAAAILRVAPSNSRSIEFSFARGANGFEAVPIRFGNDRLFLDLYATGVRGSGSVQVLLGGELLTPRYAGPQSQFAGLDQVQIELPRSFAGRGRVGAAIISGGVQSNVVELNFVN
ncbi:MAG: hypothetical protein H7039_13890 [Bryobacteraceae bacterium]|nr:hypothetical protein [Bryobacteraceae bacterium]